MSRILPHSSPIPVLMIVAWCVTANLEVVGATLPARPRGVPGAFRSSPPVKLKVVSTTGSETTLGSPIGGDWEFMVGDFSVHFFRVAAIKRIERKNDGVFELTLLTGGTFNVKQKLTGKIQGEGEWGQTSINWQQVRSVEVTPIGTPISETPEEAEDQGYPWRVTSVDGTAFELRDPHSSYGGWTFETNGFTIELSVDRLKRMERLKEDGKWRITYLDGKTFDGTPTHPDGTVTGTTPWGQARIVFSKVDQIARIAETGKLDTPGGGAYPITVETLTGATIALRDGNLMSATFAGMKIETIRWAGVQSVSNAGNALSLSGANGSAIVLREGTLTGHADMGEVTLPLTAIREIKVSGDTADTSQEKDAKQEGQIVGKVTFENGVSMMNVRIAVASTIGIHGETTSGLLELTKGGLRFWVGLDRLVHGQFKIEENRCTMNLLGVNREFDPPKQEVSIVTSIATLRGEIRHLREIAADGSVEKTTGDTSQDKEVIIERRNSTQETFKARWVRFANYPETGWTGSYFSSEWPFQWWPDESIEITKDKDAAKMSVRLSKLASIEVLGGYSSRGLRLESNEGNELVGTHFYQVLNEDQKHGPYKWKQADEGLLLKLEDDIFVFLPFLSINKASFPQAGADVHP